MQDDVIAVHRRPFSEGSFGGLLYRKDYLLETDPIRLRYIDSSFAELSHNDCGRVGTKSAEPEKSCEEDSHLYVGSLRRAHLSRHSLSLLHAEMKTQSVASD